MIPGRSIVAVPVRREATTGHPASALAGAVDGLAVEQHDAGERVLGAIA